MWGAVVSTATGYLPTTACSRLAPAGIDRLSATCAIALVAHGGDIPSIWRETPILVPGWLRELKGNAYVDEAS